MSGDAVFVTGARGFIGRAVAGRYRAQGRDVRGVDLAGADDSDVGDGDISREGPWQDAVAGCGVVVHTAAIVSNAASPDAAWAVNVLGTRHVLDAAVAAGAERVVVFSSAAVYSHRRDGLVTEQTPVRAGDTVYGDTKIAAENVAFQAHASGEIDVTVLRPSDIYGPASRPWTILPVRNLRAGRVVLPAHGRGVFDPLYIDDLVDAVVASAANADAAGQVINVGGGAPVPTAEFFGHYCRMLGIGPPRTAPTGVASALAGMVAGASRLLGRPSEITPATMRMLSGTGALAIDRARDLLGWEPRVDLADGMARTEVWLREAGEIPG